MKLIGAMYAIQHKEMELLESQEGIDGYVEEKLAIGLAREIVKELKGDIKARLLWERTEFRLDVVVLNRQEFKEYAEWKAKREAVREPK